MYLVQEAETMDFDIMSENYFYKINTRFSACLDATPYEDDNQILLRCYKKDLISNSVSLELLHPTTFGCANTQDKTLCDYNPTCFWQSGKCYFKDAPNSWRNPGHPTKYVNEFKLEEMTQCNSFTGKGEFYCPKDRCMWDGLGDNGSGLCEPIQKDFKVIPGVTNAAGAEVVEWDGLLEIERIDCDTINHKDQKDFKNECIGFDCSVEGTNGEKWCQRRKRDKREKEKKSCALNADKVACLTNNFDPNTLQNRCKWINNINDDSKGYCFDEHIPKPCNSFDKQTCPKEDSVDNMGNPIKGSAYCNWDSMTKKCTNKPDFDDKLTSENDPLVNEWKCQYNHMNTDKCNSDPNCKLINLTIGDDTLTKCINKKHQPCSTIDKTKCQNGVKDSDHKGSYPNICTLVDDRCKYNTILDDKNQRIQKIMELGKHPMIKNTKDTLDELKYITNLNRQTYLQDKYHIYGNVESVIPNNNNGGDYESFTTNSKFINNISIGDTIELINGFDTQGKPIIIGTGKIGNIDLIEKKIIFETPISLSQDFQEGVTMWLVENPNVGLFNSLQFSNVMLDTMKINNFYETY